MNALPALKTDTDEVAKLSGNVGLLVAEANQVAVFDDNSLAAATDLLGRIAGLRKAAEKERTTLVKPFNDGVKAINDRFRRGFSDPLGIAEDTVKKAILPYQVKRKQEAEAKAKEEAAAREAALLEQAAKQEAEGNTVEAELALRDAAKVKPVVEKVGYGKATDAQSVIRQVWDFEIVDKAACAAARPDLVQVDSVAVRAAIRAGEREIAGLRIFQKDTIAVR